MERYIYIRNDDTSSDFVENKPCKFSVLLKKPLHLNGIWKIALVQFDARAKSNQSLSSVYVYSNICKESVVFGEERALLRRIEPNDNNEWSENIPIPFYVPMRFTDVTQIEVLICDEKDQPVVDLLSPVHITLHLKHFPFVQEI